MGPVETAARLDVQALGELAGGQLTLAEVVYALARALDTASGEGQTTAVASIAGRLTGVMEDLVEITRRRLARSREGDVLDGLDVAVHVELPAEDRHPPLG